MISARIGTKISIFPANFGDVVGIDATFLPVNLNWSVIPLTVIGRGREIRSGGLVLFLSGVGDLYV
jgi:hypothetical protein